jgi:hypothetical protein
VFNSISSSAEKSISLIFTVLIITMSTLFKVVSQSITFLNTMDVNTQKVIHKFFSNRVFF